MAQGNLGLVYEQGRGVARDEGQAASWFRKAALQGDPHAQFRFGRACERGRGEPKDLVEAYKWYSLSAQGGYKRAQDALARLAKVLKPAELDDAQKRAAATAIEPHE